MRDDRDSRTRRLLRHPRSDCSTERQPGKRPTDDAPPSSPPTQPQVHHAELRRGSTRVIGTQRTGILLAFILAAVNASVLLSRYGYDLAAPTDASEPLTPAHTPGDRRGTAAETSPVVPNGGNPGRAPTRSTFHPARPDSFEPIT